MAHLALPRRGWENEHLAKFLLSRISFVAHPLTVGDDIGSDFICTLFEAAHTNGKQMLFPRNSFAIQVKSSNAAIAATNKIDYLEKLELPFFVGVVDTAKLRISIFSGQYLPLLFPAVGIPKKLRLHLVSRREFNKAEYEENGDSGYTLRLPFFLELSAHDSVNTLRQKERRLRKLCSQVHGNISARKSCEYVFEHPRSGKFVIMAGSGSARTFRRNFCLRLAEVFYNLDWIRKNPVWIRKHRQRQFTMAEFKVFEKCYQDLRKLGVGIPSPLSKVYKLLKSQIEIGRNHAP